MTAPKDRKPDNEWTVMFLFAGDNELAPLMVSQVKAIKDAGYQRKVDVLVHFDPNEKGVPTRLLHVNRKRKANPRVPTSVGFGGSGFGHNMQEDAVAPGEIEGDGEGALKMKEALLNSDKVTALEALSNFVGYGREKHRAKNYALILVGHGLVVGNDAFLPDEHPASAVTLTMLHEVLKEFTRRVEADGGTFQLLGLHSCAMSSLEVAYQLRGTARYMIGSEGVSYFNSWPYQTLLMNLFHTVEEADKKAAAGRPGAYAAADAREVVENFYFLSLYNARDFMLTGYSQDLALCSLDPGKYVPLKEELARLVYRLKGALRGERGRELILLAHWEAQSYWEENYTDIYDFCRCLRARCATALDALGDDAKSGRTAAELGGLAEACDAVTRRLGVMSRSEVLDERFGRLVVHADNFGSKYQYSHGLSVYFPWSRPLADDPPPPAPVAPAARSRRPETPATGILENYRGYAFTQEFGEDSWLSFLEAYFDRTQRRPRQEEDGAEVGAAVAVATGAGALAAVAAGAGAGALAADDGGSPLLFNSFGTLVKPTGAYGPGGVKPTGAYGACSCPTIKNYPTQPVPLDGREVTVKAPFITEGARRQSQ